MNEMIGKLSAMSGSITVVILSIKPNDAAEVAILAFIGGIVGLVAKKIGELLWRYLINLLKKWRM